MRIYLTGVACAGKTAVGSHLAELLSYSFFDLDDEVERHFGTSVERLQNQFITAYSYRYEASKALSALLSRPESARAVIALPPSGLMGGFWQVIKKTGGLKIVLTDRPENILSRITFYDIDSNLIDKQLSEEEKKLYLKEIKKDMSYFRKSYHRADSWIDIAGHDVEDSARKVDSLIADTCGEKMKKGDIG